MTDKGNKYANPPVIAVCGVKNSGKTSLIEKLIPILRRQGLKIAVIKHDGHDFEPDVPGTDSARLRQAGACAAAVFSDKRYMLTEEKSGVTVEEMIAAAPYADLILLEGFKGSRYPKLEVIRRGKSHESVSEREGLLAIVTDLPAEEVVYDRELPLLNLNNPEETAAFMMSYFGLSSKDAVLRAGSRTDSETAAGMEARRRCNPDIGAWDGTEAGTSMEERAGNGKVEFTHFDRNGAAWMVDVGGKADTEREAVAAGSIFMSPECFSMVQEGTVKKGDALGVARVAGIMGAKKTSELIPLCHILNLTKLAVDFDMVPERCEIRAVCTAKTTGKTGVEMEALTGVSVALLTIYDMCKAVDKNMEIGEIALLKKSGGKSGEFVNAHRCK